MEKYDIFLSYRRKSGREIARPIKMELEKHGYKVFLDLDELKDGSFNQKIKDAIASAPIFMVILSSHALDECINKDDWVRQEIECAISLKRHIIPINPDLSFKGFPENLPQHIKEELGCHQYSDILFGQLFTESVRKMVIERVIPYVQPPKNIKHQRVLWWAIASISILIVVVTTVLLLKQSQSSVIDLRNLEHFVVNGVDFEMVFVEGGEFSMGSDSTDNEAEADELPKHTVRVEDFYIGKYEITQKQWQAVMGEKIPGFSKGDAELPIVNMNFYSSMNFVRKLNELTNLEFILPTEAEWEYAAKGGKYGNDHIYSGGNNPVEVAWFKNNAHGKIQPVGQKKPNELGIYDMTGNVWEWCADYYDSTYYRIMTDFVNPHGVKLSSFKTIRGGSVQLGSSWCRNTNRDGQNPEAKDTDYGLRIVLKIK